MIRFSEKRAANPGRILRPKVKVLRRSALVPRGRVVKPAPSKFTHELKKSQPYYYARGNGDPDGKFAAGTRVVLLTYDGGEFGWVADGQGLHVETAYKGLRPLKRKKQARRKKKESQRS